MEPGAGQSERGSRLKVFSDEKVSAARFARDANVSHPTVTKYLRAWDLAANDGHVPPSTTLQAGETVQLDWEKLPSWTSFYKEANSKKKPTSENNSDNESHEDDDGGDSYMPPLEGSARRKLMTRLRAVNALVQYQPEVVTKIVDGDEDYEYIESSIMLLADWLNKIKEERNNSNVSVSAGAFDFG